MQLLLILSYSPTTHLPGYVISNYSISRSHDSKRSTSSACLDVVAKSVTEKGTSSTNALNLSRRWTKGAKKKLNPTIKSSLIYTKPNRKNKTNSNTYVIKKKANGRWLHTRLGR
jgi:hypothetical protein